MLIVNQSGQTPRGRMGEKATQRGANAIVSRRFDTVEIASPPEVCGYGTAVPIPQGAQGATSQSIADAKAPAQRSR